MSEPGVEAGTEPGSDRANDEIEVSVVLAVTGDDDDVSRPLQALRVAAAGAGCATEVIVVSHVDVQHVITPAETGDFRVIVESAPAGALTPCLWAAGYRHASGRIIAFTTTQCVVPSSWIEAIRAGLSGRDAGVGGPIGLAGDASATDWAVFHLRYSAFLSVPPNDGLAREIPGDNAAYLRALLARHESAVRDGFWEVELHHLLRAEGGTLRLLPGMAVVFAHAPTVWSIAGQRFEHGKQSGWWRVRSGARKRWQVVCAAPLVPLVLLTRIMRAVRGTGRKIRIGAVPALLILACAWAVGEAVGAVRRRAWSRCPAG